MQLNNDFLLFFKVSILGENEVGVVSSGGLVDIIRLWETKALTLIFIVNTWI